MRTLRLLFTLLFCFWSVLLCVSSSKALPEEWAQSWVRNARVIIKLDLPYVWGGSDLSKHKGLDCSGFWWASRPEQVKDYNWLKKLRADVMKKESPPLRRSTSARMERGLDGWTNRPVSEWDLEEGDLGFTDGHVFAIAEGKQGLLDIIHSRSSRGPIEEKYPRWIAKQNPRFKRLTIGDRNYRR